MKNKLKYLILLFFGTVIYSCDDRTSAEIYKEEFIAPSKAGKVSSTELWKGGLLVIDLVKTDRSETTAQINNDQHVLNSIKKGDFFEKYPNSNKCLIRRNDSIMLFDCIKLEGLENKTRDSLLPVEQWERQKINQWIYKPR
ncbi:hypothetical protein [Salinimicrobium sp. WS361]|uniref:hypothetical protein n=1 Tax=Salinimicrobium sp. WS361 TaxID=3425123 RepID=UPI003D6DF8F9